MSYATGGAAVRPIAIGVLLWALGRTLLAATGAKRDGRNNVAAGGAAAWTQPTLPRVLLLSVLVGGVVAATAGRRGRFLPRRLAHLPVRTALFAIAAAAFVHIVGIVDLALGSAAQTRDGLAASPPKFLVTSGVFAQTRNPIYFAGMLMFGPAFGVLSDSFTVLLAVQSIVSWYLVYVLVPAEETILLEAFGHRFTTWADRVPRWF